MSNVISYTCSYMFDTATGAEEYIGAGGCKSGGGMSHCDNMIVTNSHISVSPFGTRTTCTGRSAAEILAAVTRIFKTLDQLKDSLQNMGDLAASSIMGVGKYNTIQSVIATAAGSATTLGEFIKNLAGFYGIDKTTFDESFSISENIANKPLSEDIKGSFVLMASRLGGASSFRELVETLIPGAIWQMQSDHRLRLVEVDSLLNKVQVTTSHSLGTMRAPFAKIQLYTAGKLPAGGYVILPVPGKGVQIIDVNPYQHETTLRKLRDIVQQKGGTFEISVSRYNIPDIEMVWGDLARQLGGVPPKSYYQTIDPYAAAELERLKKELLKMLASMFTDSISHAEGAWKGTTPGTILIGRSVSWDCSAGITTITETYMGQIVVSPEVGAELEGIYNELQSMAGGW